MDQPNNNNSHFRIGVVSGKLGDVDGVSLEADKWIRVLSDMGHELFTFAGRYQTILPDVPEQNQIHIEKIRFNSTSQHYYENMFFPHLSVNRHPPVLSSGEKKRMLHRLQVEGTDTANVLFDQIQEREIDVILAENTNAMPMTLIGGLAVYKLAVEKKVATIFHHHDFWWERSRFSNNRIDSLLGKIMPPTEPGLEHVVLTSYAAHILRSLKRVDPMVVPNCENFDDPVTMDDYNRDFRRELGFQDTDILLVQPTRIVRRKRIEDSLYLTARLMEMYPDMRDRVHIVVSLYQGDEPDENYIHQIVDLAERKSIPLHLISDRIASQRGTDSQGRKIFTNRDVLANADMVLYLPIWEGFGNALLEAFAARVPVVTTTYLTYKTDIKILRLDTIEIRDHYDEEGRLIIPDRAVEEMHYLLTHPEEKKEIAEKNFSIARSEFGLGKLKMLLGLMLDDYGDEIRASRRRIRKSKVNYSV